MLWGVKMTVDKLIKLKTMANNILFNETTDKEFVDIIVETVLGKDWYCVNPVNAKQVNTYALLEILSKYENHKLTLWQKIKQLFVS